MTGDSLAEGQGGFASIPLLQQSWLKTTEKISLNDTIGSPGFSNFALAASAAKKGHKARRILILFIENDAYRPYIPMASNPSYSYYSNGILDTLLGPLTCRLYDIVWHHVASGLNDQQLIRARLSHQAEPASRHRSASKCSAAFWPAAKDQPECHRIDQTAVGSHHPLDQPRTLLSTSSNKPQG